MHYHLAFLVPFLGSLDFDVARILSFGTVGLGFLLAFFAYQLLSKEQSKPKPHQANHRAAYFFMGFSLILCGFGLSSEFYRANHTPPIEPTSGLFPLTQPEQTRAVGEAEAFLTKRDQGDLRGAWDSASQEMKEVFPFEQFAESNVQMKQVLGSFKERRFDIALKGLIQTRNGNPEWLYRVTFRAAYERSPLSSEMISLLRDSDGAFKVARIDVR